MATNFERFEKKATEPGLSKQMEPLRWFFISCVSREGGQFMGATFIQSPNRPAAIEDAFKKKVLPLHENVGFEDAVEVPDDKMPGELYRDQAALRWTRCACSGPWRKRVTLV